MVPDRLLPVDHNTVLDLRAMLAFRGDQQGGRFVGHTLYLWAPNSAHAMTNPVCLLARFSIPIGKSLIPRTDPAVEFEKSMSFRGPTLGRPFLTGQAVSHWKTI
jgi:hypothetical protein